MNFLRRRVVDPLFDLLRQGLSPETLALSLAGGIGAGIFPLPGITTFICFIFVFLLKLNVVAAQITNFLMTPFDLALFLPFIRMGDYILGTPSISSPSEVMEKLKSDFFGFLSTFWVALLHGILAWLIAVPIIVFVSYRILLPIMRKLGKSSRQHIA